MDRARIEYSYKHSCLVTVTVDGMGPSPSGQDDPEWRLTTFDPKNEEKLYYRLHTLDIYFWDKDDAVLFVHAAREVLAPHQVTVLDEPAAPPAHQEEMSPIVQQLESIAISDPSYQQGRTRDSRPTGQMPQAFPGPPVAPAQVAQPMMHTPPPAASAPPQASPAPPPQSAPPAYNPAAPPAPEAIRHREKTPPPEDGAVNPLATAAVADHGQMPTMVPPGFNQFAPPPPSALNYFSGPPQASSSPYAQPPPQPVQRTQSYPVGLPQAGHNPNAQFMPQAHTAVYGAPAPNYSSPLSSPGFAPPPPSTGIPYTSVHVSPPPPPTILGPSYSNYQYQAGNAAPQGNEYAVHHQVYRPTEGEAAVRYAPKREPRGKLEEQAGKLEKGVTGLFKKIEKKYL
jgi:hypothetical protein